MSDDLRGSHDGGYVGTNDVPACMCSVVLGNVDGFGKVKRALACRRGTECYESRTDKFGGVVGRGNAIYAGRWMKCK